jgi:hypothetical protein
VRGDGQFVEQAGLGQGEDAGTDGHQPDAACVSLAQRPATGGFEIAFRLLQRIYGDDVAKESILHAEYAPEPLFAVETPELAGPELTARAKAHVQPLMESFEQVMAKVEARLAARV